MDYKKQLSRSRMRCTLCNEVLGYTAYKRHQDLPHLFCPGFVLPAKRHHEQAMSDSSDSTFVLEDSTTMPPSLHSDVNDEVTDYESQMSEQSSSSKSSDTNDSAPEVWDETDSSLSENECDAEDSNMMTAVKQLHYTVCLLLSFFQLCFHVSVRALTYLLSFLSALLKHLCSFIQNDYLTAFARMFPTTLYSLRKQLNLKSPYTTYVVCPKCHTLYKEADCFKTTSDGTTTTLRCTYIEFPNHPRQANRKECGTERMKKLKLDKHINLHLGSCMCNTI